MVGRSVLLSVAALFCVSKAQDACETYTWNANEFPDNQNFAELLGDAYLNSSDFDVGGEYYGQSWETVFWKNVNQSSSPPEAKMRPLGFKYAKLGPYNDPTVCLQVRGVAGYKVELMVYTLTPQASLCMVDMAGDEFVSQDTGALATCDEQYIYNCFTADTNENILNVAVYCKENCMETNTHMLWRFRRSELAWDDTREWSSENPEMWCDMIARDINWPDEIDEALPEVYEAVDNLDSANMISALLASVLAGVVALLY